MKQFRIMPSIVEFNSCREFADEFKIGKGDLIFTNPTYFEKYFSNCVEGAHVVYAKNYGTGEPTDIMVDKIANDIGKLEFDRLIAIGGGSIIDISKLLVQETITPVEQLYDKIIPTKKVKELVIVPTTCGTGSEVTSVSVIELTGKGTKMGLQTDEEFADLAVLIPELLDDLPMKVFASSSIDALIHAIESYMSPKATAFSEMFSVSAIQIILKGYLQIEKHGENTRKEYNRDFLLASTYAGIAFGNAGCAAVHAMSMVFGGIHHVPHGESNYVMFTEVYKAYQRIQPKGKIEILNQILSQCLGCSSEEVYMRLEALLGTLLEKKSLKEYGVTKVEIPSLAELVETKQGRLTANNYVPLTKEDMINIYNNLY